MNINGFECDAKFFGDKEYKFFVFDGYSNDSFYFKNAHVRDEAATYIIEAYLDDGWHEGVEQIICGELTHTCEKVDVIPRPPEDEIDEDGHDEDCNYWADEYDYICNYKMVKLEDK